MQLSQVNPSIGSPDLPAAVVAANAAAVQRAALRAVPLVPTAGAVYPANAAAVAVDGVAAAGPEMAQPSAATIQLADLTTGAEARVVAIGTADSNPTAELARRLAELGFLPGEKLRIVARGLLGREPIAVRIGTGTFALRLFEAACIRVCPEQPKLR